MCNKFELKAKTYPSCWAGPLNSTDISEIAQREMECIALSACPPRGPGSIPSHGRIFRGISLADDIPPTRPQPAWQKMAQSPLNDTTELSEQRGGRPKLNYGQAMGKTTKGTSYCR